MVSPYPLAPIANFLACLLVLISLSKTMLQTWNVGACSFAMWIISQTLQFSINAIVWRKSVHNFAPIWCDIGGRKQVSHYYIVNEHYH